MLSQTSVYAARLHAIVHGAVCPFTCTDAHCAYLRPDGHAELDGCMPRWFACPKTVIHPSTGRARRRVTSLIKALSTKPNCKMWKNSSQQIFILIFGEGIFLVNRSLFCKWPAHKIYLLAVCGDHRSVVMAWLMDNFNFKAIFTTRFWLLASNIQTESSSLAQLSRTEIKVSYLQFAQSLTIGSKLATKWTIIK